MAEIRRGGEKLPWLEPVEDEEAYEEPAGGGGFTKLILLLAAVVALLIVAIVMFGRWQASRADLGEVIRAPAGPYKERPKDPGGLKVDGSGIVAEKTGTGADINAPLDLSALPEEPVTGPGVPRAPAPAPTQAAKPAPAAPSATASIPLAPVRPITEPAAPLAATKPALPKPQVAPVPAPSGGSGTIQLGALASEAKAKSVWKSLSGRFAFLAPLTMSITPVTVGDKTLYRLRASGGDARNLCARLKVAGEACTVVG